MEKARMSVTTLMGSLFDLRILIQPLSRGTPFKFPFLTPSPHPTIQLHDRIMASGGLLGSVSRVVGLPHVFGLHGVEKSAVKIIRAAIASNAIDNPQLMDGGVNICLTGILSLLVDVVSIPPLPILVATTSGALSLDDCCTKRGLLPLTLQDGSIYYQPCYYCKNATKTIISLEAILVSSNILVCWQQEGHKDARPGTIWFFSNRGLYNITLALEKQDGLYYCPTDVFDIDVNPNQHSGPQVSRIAVLDTIPHLTRLSRYQAVSSNQLTESELWMLRLGSPR
jgi:hypothetical protein